MRGFGIIVLAVAVAVAVLGGCERGPTLAPLVATDAEAEADLRDCTANAARVQARLRAADRRVGPLYFYSIYELPVIAAVAMVDANTPASGTTADDRQIMIRDCMRARGYDVPRG